MRNFAMNFFTAVGVLTVFGLMAACFSDSTAGGSNTNTQAGPTDAEFADLKKRVDDLETQLEVLANSINVVLVKDSATGVVRGMSKAEQLANSIPANCKSSGYLSGEHLLAKGVECKSDSGVLYSHPFKGGKPADVIRVNYATSDCSDPGYFSVNGIAGTNLEAHGGVFQTEKGDVVWIPADAPRTTANIIAWWDPGFGCQPYNTSTPPDSLIEVLPNDPALSGVDNNLPPIYVE